MFSFSQPWLSRRKVNLQAANSLLKQGREVGAEAGQFLAEFGGYFDGFVLPDENGPPVAACPYGKIRAHQIAGLAHNFQRRIARGHEQRRKRAATQADCAGVHRKRHRREAMRNEPLEYGEVRDRELRHAGIITGKPRAKTGDMLSPE